MSLRAEGLTHEWENPGGMLRQIPTRCGGALALNPAPGLPAQVRLQLQSFRFTKRSFMKGAATVAPIYGNSPLHTLRAIVKHEGVLAPFKVTRPASQRAAKAPAPPLPSKAPRPRPNPAN